MTASSLLRRRLLVDGIVQGVGFRPFVYNLARSENLVGFVTNTSDGVVIEIQGSMEVPALAVRTYPCGMPVARLIG